MPSYIIYTFLALSVFLELLEFPAVQSSQSPARKKQSSHEHRTKDAFKIIRTAKIVVSKPPVTGENFEAAVHTNELAANEGRPVPPRDNFVNIDFADQGCFLQPVLVVTEEGSSLPSSSTHPVVASRRTSTAAIELNSTMLYAGNKKANAWVTCSRAGKWEKHRPFFHAELVGDVRQALVTEKVDAFTFKVSWQLLEPLAGKVFSVSVRFWGSDYYYFETGCNDVHASPGHPSEHVHGSPLEVHAREDAAANKRVNKAGELNKPCETFAAGVWEKGPNVGSSAELEVSP